MYFFKRRERKEELVSVLLFSLTPFMATVDAKGTGGVAATLVPPSTPHGARPLALTSGSLPQRLIYRFILSDVCVRRQRSS